MKKKLQFQSYIECSGKTQENLKTVFDDVVSYAIGITIF
jgi:hypothetical protein